jgi:hypothetical protein
MAVIWHVCDVYLLLVVVLNHRLMTAVVRAVMHCAHVVGVLDGQQG